MSYSISEEEEDDDDDDERSEETTSTGDKDEVQEKSQELEQSTAADVVTAEPVTEAGQDGDPAETADNRAETESQPASAAEQADGGPTETADEVSNRAEVTESEGEQMTASEKQDDRPEIAEKEETTHEETAHESEQVD